MPRSAQKSRSSWVAGPAAASQQDSLSPDEQGHDVQLQVAEVADIAQSAVTADTAGTAGPSLTEDNSRASGFRK